MSEKKIAVCLDVKNGKVTKGIKFEGNVELGDPVEMAADYNRQGADVIVLYDITAAMEDRTAVLEQVAAISKVINVPFMVGGGISSVEHIKNILNKGGNKVSINSPAVKRPELIKEASKYFGSHVISLGVDALKDNSMPCGYRVVIGGGKVKTELDLLKWLQEAEKLGAGEIILNSVDADGVKEGYDCELTKMVKDNVAIPVVASGGAGKIEHISEMFIKTNADTALIASMAHYKIATIQEIKEHLKKKLI